MRHYRFKRRAFAPTCCAMLKKNRSTRCSNTGIYVNELNNYCGAHLHTLDREIEVYDLMIHKEVGYEPRVVFNTTLRTVTEVQEDQCCICMENIAVNMGVLTRCGHSFHLRCFEKWNVALNKNTCPLCRESIRE
jgi:hypothetical protein